MPIPDVTLTAEDGTGLEAANSYVSLAFASEYLAANAYAAAWFAETLDNQARSRHLIRAAQIIDSSVIFSGFPRVRLQGLQWPRTAALDPYAIEGTAGFVEEDEVPRPIKQAACEIAYRLLTTDLSVDGDDKGVRALKLGKGALEVEFNAQDRQRVFDDYLETLLGAYGAMRFRSSGVSPLRR